MKSVLKILGLGTLLLFLPLSIAHAAAPTVAAISDLQLNIGATSTINVVALDADNDPITLTSTLPAYATLNAPTSGTGLVTTTISLNPLAGSAGTFNASVTATAGEQTSTENFLITVVEAGSDQAPVVTAPAIQNATVGNNLTFTVTASDADANAITSLTPTGAPAGATFTPNGTYTSGVFSWTPTAGQAGTDYDVIFTAANALSGSATTHLHVAPTVSIAPIADLTVAEGSTATANVNVTGTAGYTSNVTASLPAFATLNAPLSGLGGVTTTVSIAPLAGSAGTYHASVTATTGSASSTELFDIFVTAAGGNSAPVVTAPDTRTVNEGDALSFNVSASDVNGDHVTLSATGVPSGATFNDNGDNTGTFSWTPGSTQSGTYVVTFAGDDGHGGTATDATTITVLDVGGGQGNATAVLQGKFRSEKKWTCFRIRPVNGSFDVRTVTLSSITLNFGGGSVTALAGKTHLTFDCDGDDHDGDGDGEDRDGDCDGGHDARAISLDGGHPHGDDDDCDCDCDECDDDDGEGDNADCTAVGIRACFSTQEVLALFGDTHLPDGFTGATIGGSMTGGGTFVATIDAKFAGNNGNQGHGKLHAKARPNPLNPKTEVSFTLSQAGRVQVAVYDIQGRLVNKLLDEFRPAGEQKLTWDGSNARKERVTSGVYFFRIQAVEGKEIQRVAVVK
jgi:hypothetical protein